MAGSKKGKAQIAKLPEAKNNEEHVYAASHCCAPFAPTGENDFLPSVRLPGPRTFAVRFPLRRFALFG
jgi:hypothetical protein